MSIVISDDPLTTPGMTEAEMRQEADPTSLYRSGALGGASSSQSCSSAQSTLCGSVRCPSRGKGSTFAPSCQALVGLSTA